MTKSKRNTMYKCQSQSNLSQQGLALSPLHRASYNFQVKIAAKSSAKPTTVVSPVTDRTSTRSITFPNRRPSASPIVPPLWLYTVCLHSSYITKSPSKGNSRLNCQVFRNAYFCQSAFIGLHMAKLDICIPDGGCCSLYIRQNPSRHLLSSSPFLLHPQQSFPYIFPIESNIEAPKVAYWLERNIYFCCFYRIGNIHFLGTRLLCLNTG